MKMLALRNEKEKKKKKQKQLLAALSAALHGKYVWYGVSVCCVCMKVYALHARKKVKY